MARNTRDEGQSNGSALAYTPYSSKRHSRGSSLASALPNNHPPPPSASAAEGPTQSGLGVSTSAQSRLAGQPNDDRLPAQSNGSRAAKPGMQRMPTSLKPLPHTNGTQQLAPAVAGGAPPPLRRISEMRKSTSSSTITASEPAAARTPNGKGKQRAAEPIVGSTGDEEESRGTIKASHGRNGSGTNSTTSSRAPTPSSPSSTGSSRQRPALRDKQHHSTQSASSHSTPFPLSLPPTNMHANPSSSLYTSLVQDPIPIPAGPALARAAGAGGGDDDTSFDRSLPTAPFAGGAGPARPTAGRLSTYRSGFQARGVRRILTDEFESARRKSRSGEARRKVELTEERLTRRLEKLLAVHANASEAARTEAVQKEKARREASEARASAALGDGDDASTTARSVRGVAGNVWSTLRSRATQFANSLEDPEIAYIRSKEQEIVHWEDDRDVKKCPICSTSFSLAVRKHHCRLCGRVVCASPQLTRLGPMESAQTQSPDGDDTQQKCSGLVVADPHTMRISSTFLLNREDEQHQQQRDEKTGDRDEEEKDTGAQLRIRICRECKETVCRKQYMLDEGKAPTHLKLYDALMRLQREIEEGLPEFQEMVLGLQKQDANATLGVLDDMSLDGAQTKQQQQAHARMLLSLQKDAASARKQLLANFANYDALARRIKNLPPENSGPPGVKPNITVGVDSAQERLQQAIWTRANLFLQLNMFPLQSLPRLGDKAGSSDGTRSPAGSTSELMGEPSNTALNSNGRSGTTQPSSNQRSALQQQLSVLLEQEELVSSYANSASKARKFDDAKSLRASLEELRKEIALTKRKLGNV